MTVKRMGAGITRRDMMRAAAIVPATAVAGSATNSAVTVGLIGAGGRGSTDASILTANTTARITAISDLYDEKIDALRQRISAPNAKTYKNYGDLLASDVDAVIIATPVFLHPEHFEAAVKAGKHIYIEKPAAPDVAGCKRIMRAADSADRKLNISFGFQRRYGQVYRKAKAALDAGGIGALRMVHLHFVKAGGSRQRVTSETMPSDLESQLKQWYSWRKLSGDLIVENNIHLIDVMNWFAGSHAERAHGWGSRLPGKRGDVRDQNNVSFEYPGGVQGTLFGSTLAPPFYRHVYERFFGETGVIETAAEYWAHQRGKNDKIREDSPRNVTADSLAEFVRRIAEGEPENTGVRGAETTLTAIMGRMAMDLKRPVEWAEVLSSDA